MNSSQSTLKIHLVCYFHGYLACQWNLLNKCLKRFIPPRCQVGAIRWGQRIFLMHYKDAVVLTDDHDCCFFPLNWERCHSWSCRSDLLERHPKLPV